MESGEVDSMYDLLATWIIACAMQSSISGALSILMGQLAVERSGGKGVIGAACGVAI